jgi:hypothetical protein
MGRTVSTNLGQSEALTGLGRSYCFITCESTTSLLPDLCTQQ